MADEFSQVLVTVGDSQIPSYVEDCQPLPQNPLANSTLTGTIIVKDLVHSMVKSVVVRVAKMIAKTRKEHKAHMKNHEMASLHVDLRSGPHILADQHRGEE